MERTQSGSNKKLELFDLEEELIEQDVFLSGESNHRRHSGVTNGFC
ncbi:hypothetical protein [uncultured Lactobacillus sp.]|nr:hypothetical protein [uncultured Lactobacillus sp.]